MRIGIVSDTHNYFDPVIREHFAGVDHILHAGDVCTPSIILELENIAPVTVVMGNNDTMYASLWRETECVELDGVRFLLHHIVTPESLSDAVRRALQRHRPHVVVYGHSHQAREVELNSVLFFNPGYAGKPRFNQPRSLAVMEIADSRIINRRFIQL